MDAPTSKTTWTRDQVGEKIKQELEDLFGSASPSIAEESTLDSLGLDSLDVAELQLIVEELFVLPLGSADKLLESVELTVAEVIDKTFALVNEQASEK